MADRGSTLSDEVEEEGAAQAARLVQERLLSFEAFVTRTEPRLRGALVALYGTERGREATAEALAYAWEHWEQLVDVQNLPGYLFRVAQSKSRPRRARALFAIPESVDHDFEPKLPEALRSLSGRQRLAVVLVYGLGWDVVEVSKLTGVKPTTVRNHLERGLHRLRKSLGVTQDA